MKRNQINHLTTAIYLFIFLISGQVNAQTDNRNSGSDLGESFIHSRTDSLRQKISGLNIPGLTITDIKFIDTGSYKPAVSENTFTGLPPFCLVAATIKPAPESNIRIELWMPQHNWNNRFLGTGNGGGAGNIAYGSLADGLRKGYATANTDMGTSPYADAAINHPERWIDFGYRATHLMTVVSKEIIKVFYNQAQHDAYFMGCSTGGQQALMEAQRYPRDYNGIIAGAPANNRTHLHTEFLYNHKLTNQNGTEMFSQEDISYITRTIIAAYAEKDGGAPEDNFLTDPRKFKFDPEALFKCKDPGKDSCLSDVQIETLKKIYAGPVNPGTGEQIYTPFPPGSESNFGGLAYQQSANGFNDLAYQYKWVFGADFDYTKFDFDKDQAKLDSILAPILNANDPNLNPFKKCGGKLIMYTGTADPLVPYPDAINYYERVVRTQKDLNHTQSFFRYFLVPGMGHCGGGSGLNRFGVQQDSEHDILLALVKWVEQGKAPEKIIATALNCCDVPNAPQCQRPVYPYPKFPEYIGGDPNSPSSYQGVDHQRGVALPPSENYLK